MALSPNEFNFYAYLWKKDKYGNSCPGILIPDTLIFTEESQLLYFCSKSKRNLNKILKKNRSFGNLYYGQADILNRFGKQRVRPRELSDVPDLNVTKKHSRTSGTVVAKLLWEENMRMKTKYLNPDQLKDFIEKQWPDESGSDRDSDTEQIPHSGGQTGSKLKNYILQKFVEPSGARNSTIKVIWTQKSCHMKICTNKNNYDDLEIDVSNRMTTYDEKHQPSISLTVEKNVSRKSLIKTIISSCNAIAKHISMGSSQYMEVCQMTVYFRLGKSGSLYTLRATNFDCSNHRSSTRSMLSVLSKSQRRRKVVPHKEESRNRIDINSKIENKTLLELWGQDTDEAWDDIDPIQTKDKRSMAFATRNRGDSIRLETFQKNLEQKYESNIEKNNSPKKRSAKTLLQNMLLKKKSLNGFKCPVEHCDRVESLHSQPCEATIKDIVDFYNSGFRINQDLNSLKLEELVMLGVAPLFGPKKMQERDIPSVLQKYVPGKSKRRYYLLCKDPNFMYRTIRVCRKCSFIFLNRAKLSLKNQVAANNFLNEEALNRGKTAKLIRKCTGPVLPIRSKLLDRLATAKYKRKKYVSQSTNHVNIKQKRPASAGARLSSKKSKTKFDVPRFDVPPRLPKNLEGWEPPKKWKEILESRRSNTSSAEYIVKKHYSTYSIPKQIRNDKAAKKRSRRPESAPSSRQKISNESCTASEKTRKMIEMQFKIYGVKSLADLKKNNFIRSKHHISKLTKADKTNNTSSGQRQRKSEKIKHSHSAAKKKQNVRKKSVRRQKNMARKVKTTVKRRNTTRKGRQCVDEAGLIQEQINNIEDPLYSFEDHQAFIETAKSIKLQYGEYNDKTGGNDTIHPSSAPLNLAPLSPSFIEKAGRHYVAATKSGEVLV